MQVGGGSRDYLNITMAAEAVERTAGELLWKWEKLQVHSLQADLSLLQKHFLCEYVYTAIKGVTAAQEPRDLGSRPARARVRVEGG